MAEANQKRSLSRARLIFFLILLAAVILRIVYIMELTGSELSAELSMDSEFYRELALDIISGRGLPEGALTFNPLYPFFLSLVFAVFGSSLLATRIIQSLLGIITVLLVYQGSRKLAQGHRKGDLNVQAVALTAMAITALYPQFILYEGMILGSTLEILLLVISFNLALSLDRELVEGEPVKLLSRRIKPWLIGGILGLACGAGAMGRPNLFLLLIAGIPLWLIIRNWMKRNWILPLIGFAAGVVLILLPPTVYNYLNSGSFVPVTAHGGINFYIGNRPGTHGVYQPPEGIRGEMRGLIEDSRKRAEKETGRQMTDAETSDYYIDKAMDRISENPGGWIALLGRKLILFWNGIEVHDIPEVLYFSENLPVFNFPFIPFMIIAPLGLAGFIVLIRSGSYRSVIILFLGAAHLSILLFYLNSRYRLPIVPVIIALAAYLVAWLAREISKNRIKQAAVMLAVAMAVFLLISSRTIVEANKSNLYNFLGTYYMNEGKQEKAAQAFMEAYRLNPKRDTSMINYGKVLVLRGEYQKAYDIFSRAYRQNPDYPYLATMYAYTLQKMGRHGEAARIARRIYSSGQSSERVTACKILATAAYFRRDFDEAMKWVRAGLKIAPDDPILQRMEEAMGSTP